MKEQVHVIERLAKGTKCKDCVSFRECARDATLPAFEAGQAALCKGFAPRKPVTNADRIRAMSDEELALELLAYCPSDSVFKGTCLEGKARYSAADGQYYKNGSEAVKANLDWLRQPVEDGDNDG